jgi:hypothetical protein
MELDKTKELGGSPVIGGKMESTSIKDLNGIGKWILILGCPLAERHSLFDPVQNASGPTFAVCACCEFQQGRDFEFRDPTGEFPIVVHPHLLKFGCPYSPQD